MDKVKKFVILPVSLLLLELFLQFQKPKIDYFRFLLPYFKDVIPHILLSILAVLIFVCGIAVLFAWVFDTASLKPLINQSTIKAAAIAFTVYYLAIVAVIPFLIDGALVRLYSVLLDQVPICMIIEALFNSLKKFFLIYLILWIFLKPTGFKLNFRKRLFILSIFICIIINVPDIYVEYQIRSTALSAALQTAMADNSSIGFLNLFTYSNKYDGFLKIVSSIVYSIQDVIILVFINSCIKSEEKVEIQSV